MKKLFLSIMAFFTIVICPFYASAETHTLDQVVLDHWGKLLEFMKIPRETTSKYAITDIDVRREPKESAEILSRQPRNAQLSVVMEANGWSVVEVESGLAYARTDQLSGQPLLNYTEEELYIMAHVLAGEAQNCTDQEQLYVGSVVLNRVKHPQFPNTIKGVVFQKGQYSCTWDGNYYRNPTDRNWANAKNLLENGSVLPEHVIWQSKAKQGRGVYLKTSAHYYCY